MRVKSLWPAALFLSITAVFLYPIFLGKVFFPGDLLYQWFPWYLSSPQVLKELLPVNNAILGDAVTAFYPWFTFLGRALTSGFFPLWNPLVMAGAPLLANWQSGALALENIVFYLFKTPLALSIHIFLKVFLTLSFSYLFLRKLKLSPEASVFGSLAYAFSAFFVVWLNWPQTRVAMWLPLILFAEEHLIEKPKLNRTAIFSFAIAAAILAGHPGTLIQVFLIAIVYGIFRIFQSEQRLTKIAYLLLGLVIGLGLGAVLILPGIEMMKNSYQYGRRSATDFLKLSLGPGNLILLFFPRFYGHLKEGIYIGPANFNEVSAYIGLMPLLFVFWAITFTKKYKQIWSMLVLSLFSVALIYSIWPQSLLYKLPLISMQPTERYIFILTFCLSVLAAFGFDAFFKEGQSRWRLALLVALFISVMLLIFYKINPLIWLQYKHLYFLMILPFFAFLGAYLKRENILLKWLLIGLLVFDLFIFGLKLNSYIKKEYIFPQNEITSFINKDKSIKRVLPLVDTFLPNTLMPYGVEDLRGRDALILNRFYKVASLLSDKDSLSLPNFILPSKIDSPLLDFLNVKYIISDIPLGNSLPRKLISPTGFAEVYKDSYQKQTFMAENDNLAGVGLLVGTFREIGNPAVFTFKLFDDKENLLREKEIKASLFRDNSYFPISFKPISNSKNKRFSFSIEGPNVSRKNHIAVRLSGYDQYREGNHFDNGLKRSGDLAFYLQYYKPLTKFKKVFRYKNLTIYENKEVLPRAFVVRKSVVRKNVERALARATRNELGELVYLNKKPVFGGEANSYKVPPWRDKGEEEVKIVSYQPNSVIMKAKLPSRGIIVVSDNYYPGWNAYIDGRKASIYIANLSFRAVAVKEGIHRIEMRYQPTSFRNGLIISSLLLLTILGFVALPLTRKET